ncbi:MAG: exonuclease domain-containing protein, partial [Akkermansiaceae bacterium]
MNFTSIDFETATASRDSACAVGIVTVENGCVTHEYYSLIRPPENAYSWHNIQVHGIQPAHTENERSFPAIVAEITDLLAGRIIVAHNAPFDKSVFNACVQS